MFNNERFVIVRETCKITREYMVRVTDEHEYPVDSVLLLNSQQEYIDGSEKDVDDGEQSYDEIELPENWQKDLTLLKYARFIMDNNGLLGDDANAVPVKKKRKRRKIVQGSPQIEQDSVDIPTKSDIMSEPNWSQLAKEMTDG